MRLGLSSFQTGVLLALLVTILAAIGWLFTKVALREFEPISFIAWRFFIAAIVMLYFSRAQWRLLSIQQIKISLLIGVVLAVALCIWVEGMYRVAYIGEAAFIVSLMVVIVPLIAIFFGERFSLFLGISLLPAIIGLYLLTGAQGIFQFEVGQLLLLLSAVLFSLHVVLSTHYTKAIPAGALTGIQLIAVTVIAMIWSIQKGSLLMPLTANFTGLTWSMLLSAALIATSLRFFVLSKTLMLISSHDASMVFVLGPVWTAVLGWLFLSEHMSQLQLLGCAIIFLAQVIYLFSIVNTRKSNRV